MTTSSTRPTVRLEDLRYRRATWKDHALLHRYRVECGWGVERMESDLKTPEDTPLWVFSLEEENEKEEQGQGKQLIDIGMGGLVLESIVEPLLASRATGSVKLSGSATDRKRSTVSHNRTPSSQPHSSSHPPTKT